MVHVCFVSPKIHNFLNTGEPAGAGGAERQQYLIGRELLRRGHDVSLVTRNFDDGEARIRSEGFDVWKTIPDVRGVRNAPSKGLHVLNTLRRVGADVHYVRGNDFLCVLTGAFCRVASARFVYAVSVDEHVEPEALRGWHPIRRRAFLTAVRGADAVAAQTEYQHDILVEVHGVESTVVPNGYALPPREDILPHGDREHVLWIGRMAREQKRPKRFIDLARALPDVRFVMVGPPNDDEEAYFERLRTEAEGVNNLRFVGFVPPSEVSDYYRRASVLVNTSASEGFPNTFLEAWRWATPVVSLEYDLNGTLREGRIGRHAGSMERLKIDVESLATGVDRRAELGWNARKHVAANYVIDSVADRYETLLKRVVTG